MVKETREESFFCSREIVASATACFEMVSVRMPLIVAFWLIADKLMKEKNVALCPTLAAGDAIQQYRGWKKGVDTEPQSIVNKKKSFQLALNAGVTICMGGDVGVFAHGDNAREMEMMVDYGMKAIDVLRS